MLCIKNLLSKFNLNLIIFLNILVYNEYNEYEYKDHIRNIIHNRLYTIYIVLIT